MADIIDGRKIARELDEKTAAQVAELEAKHGVRPGLAVVLVGNDPASEVYVGRKMKRCEAVGIRSFEHRLPAETTQDALLTLIARLNADPEVHGILVQVPLPDHIDTGAILSAIDPNKDVDGFHPVNVGRLATGTGGIVPCTPLGVTLLLDTLFDDLTGLDVVVIGKSNIVGKPIAMLMLEREATVTVTHIYTENLPDICRKADIIIAAAGAPELVKGFWVKPGAVIIDVGITRTKGEDGKTKLVGDVDFDDVQHARAVTPVPGGVGPMTIACLLANTVQAARSALENGAASGWQPQFDDAPDRSLIYASRDEGEPGE
jgi:methylenetetrahydrofolate dehydrogenase (NADP+)/methenyltetrahydrofolate cyclohydrolase